jgi:L-histidine N-alpha-methyltransferase
VEYAAGSADRRSALLDETFWSLRETPKQLSPTWLYDELGSLLFEEITRLPEYYLTRAEYEVLEVQADTIACLSEAETFIELGSGSARKTRLLLAALDREGTLRRFVPLDVSEEILRESAEAIAGHHDGLQVHAIVGDFMHHLGSLPEGPSRLVALLGSTVGNLYPEPRASLYRAIADQLEEGDCFLLGIDLVKDVDRLERAYNDSAGVTERFVRNALTALNRELGAEFAQERFAYRAVWDEEHSWIDIGLVSLADQTVPLGLLEYELSLSAGEPIRMEVSSKFTRETVERELAGAGLGLERWWTDRRGDFALCLAVPDG